MVADESGTARVYGMDIQRDALENTSSLLDENVTPKEVILFSKPPSSFFTVNHYGLAYWVLDSGICSCILYDQNYLNWTSDLFIYFFYWPFETDEIN